MRTPGELAFAVRALTRRRWLRADGSWLTVSVAVLAACNNPSSNGQVCTALYAYVTATVVDTAGAPVTDLAIGDSVLRTHQAFDVAEQGLGIFTPGTYTIFSDSYLNDVRASGDSVQVTGSSSSTGPGLHPQFSTVYTFGSDGCHVRKIAGPGTVVAR